MMPEKQRFEFDRETEARRRELRSASDAHRDFDGDLSRKILIAPEASPIPVAGIDEITARIPRENTQEEARAPIKMEDHNDTAQGMSSRGDAADEDVRGPPSPPRSDRTGEKRSPLLVDAILKATQKPGRAKGQRKLRDVAIVLNPDDLSKALLVSSDDLAHAPRLPAEFFDKEEQTTSGLQCVLALEATNDLPIVRSLPPKHTVAFFQEERTSLYPPPVAAADGNDGATKQEDSVNIERVDSALDWCQMYRMFFRILKAGGKLNRNVFLPNAADALTQFQAVSAVAERYSSPSELRVAFKEGVLSWIGNSSFYPAIKEDPSSWLEIGIKMQNENAFKEAFVHCVGALANLSSDRIPGLDDQLRNVIEPKAQALEFLRRKIELKLLYGMSLQKSVSRGSEKGQTYIASISNDSVSWIVVSLFSEWVKEHLQYLSEDGDDDNHSGAEQTSKERVSIRATATCDHEKTVKCLTVGGFFRLLGKGDDSYLPSDTVLELVGALWDGGLDKEDQKTALDALRELKETAAKIVRPLVEKSGLQYAGQEELEYLTCVEVSEEDIPWKVKDGHDDVDEDDEMEW